MPLPDLKLRIRSARLCAAIKRANLRCLSPPRTDTRDERMLWTLSDMRLDNPEIRNEGRDPVRVKPSL
jgi:hypothetical protein